MDPTDRADRNEGRRIAILLPDLRGGGVERMRLVLAREFLRRGFGVDIVLGRAAGELLTEIPAGARLVDLKARRLAGVFAPLVAYLRRERPAAVLAAMWPLTVIAVAATRLSMTGARVVVSDHNTLSLAFERRGRAHRLAMGLSIAAAYPLADARVAVSRGIIQDLTALSGICGDRFTVIHNPAGGGAPAAGGDAPGLWGEARGARILSVGSLKPQKNHALLIRAFARAAEAREATLLILGEGASRPQLEALVSEMGLGGRVLMPGFAADTGPYYRTADLFVFSSDYEGFGNVLVEALAAGLPVVSTDCPSGPAEILGGGRFGALTPCGDVGAMAAAIGQALDQPREPERLRARAAVFSPAAAADVYLDLLLPGARAA